MGKSSRVKSAKETIAQMKKEQEARLLAEKKRKTKITIITSVVCVVLAAAFISTIAIISVNRKNGNFLRKQTVLSTDNFSINGTTFNYFLNYEYQNFVNTYADQLESYGLDVSVPLREQETSDGQNWFDYMVGRAQSNLEELLRLCEKAKAEGYELDEADQKQKKDYIDTLTKEAENNDMSVDEYISLLYGEGVKPKDIEAGLDISMLATKYYEKNFGAKEYSEDQINTYYDENKNTFLAVDYIYYNFTATQSNGLNQDEADETLKQAKANADKLAKAKNPDDFTNILSQIIKDEGGDDADVSDTLSNIEAKGCTYDEEFPVSKWAFGDDAKLYGTKIYENENRVGVYMLTKLPYRDENETRSVRHILISISDDMPDADAKKKAEEILAEYNKGEKTATAFGELATKYTDDTGSAETGGLYENFTKGTMVEEFEDWSFDAARKEGDTGIVKTTYGYHIMYFVAKGQPVWKNSVVAAMKDAEYTKLFEELEKKHKITFNTEVLDNIETIVFRTSDTTAA